MFNAFLAFVHNISVLFCVLQFCGKPTILIVYIYIAPMSMLFVNLEFNSM